MPSQPRKFRFPRWTNTKARGELAESIFVVKAQALGLAVSRPLGDNQPFDFHVEGRIGTFRVQVKSAWNVPRFNHVVFFKSLPRKRSRGFDVVVVYIAPMDLWYVIPAWAVRHRWLPLYPQRVNSNGRYEKYREGWRTLTGDVHDDTRRIGLEIHAGTDS